MTSQRPERRITCSTPPWYFFWLLAKVRLNQPKKPVFSSWWPFGIGSSMVAHSAGVRIRATRTDSTMAATMVSENCR